MPEEEAAVQPWEPLESLKPLEGALAHWLPLPFNNIATHTPTLQYSTCIIPRFHATTRPLPRIFFVRHCWPPAAAMPLEVCTDTLQPLAHVRSRHNTPLVRALLDVCADAGPADTWIDSLECLYLCLTDDDDDDGSDEADYSARAKRRRGVDGPIPAPASPPPKLLATRSLNPLSGTDASRNYVAVSYTWTPSVDECATTGGYLVPSRDRPSRNVQSAVRDHVWDRVLRFADYVRCPNIWVDRDCIDQADEVEKEAAMQSMHLVYSLSRCPVGLLTCTFTTERQLDLLANLLNATVRSHEQAETLKLLQHVLSSPWWDRAWPFQEDYRATTRIKLLIPHTAELEATKRGHRRPKGTSLFGALPGEIVVKSVDFKRQATKFCLDYQQRFGSNAACIKILETAGRYTELLREGVAIPGMPSIMRSMSPTIFADVCRRGIDVESDRLDIIANCCEYDMRLAKRAHSGQRSLSILLLGLFLINGEVMENDPARCLGTQEHSVLTYLQSQSLRSFRPVIHKELTFMKSCRFTNPKLTIDGILTSGHLWKLGRHVRCKAIPKSDSTVAEILQLLSMELRSGTYGQELHELAEHIDDCVSSSSQATNTALSSQHPSTRWIDQMAKQVAWCFRRGKPLQIATLVVAKGKSHDRANEDRQPSAIFAVEDGQNCHERDANDDSFHNDQHGDYVFTSLRWAGDERDSVDKHLSLQVRLAPSEDDDSSNLCQGDSSADTPSLQTASSTSKRTIATTAPRLYVDRWINGLCFFAGHARQDVVFPWPAALTE